MDAPVLHRKIKRQCQQRIGSLRFAITGNEQKEGNDDQISGIKVFWQKLPKKSCSILTMSSWLLVDNFMRWERRTRLRNCLFFCGNDLRWRCRPDGGIGFFQTFTTVGAVRLWNIAVIHRHHLPPWLNAIVANFAIFAACMAFSSLSSRSLVRYGFNAFSRVCS